MVKKIIVLAFTILFVLSGAIMLYAQCDQIGKHFDVGTEHQGRSIHCSQTYVSSNGQQTSTVRLRPSRLFSKFMPEVEEVNKALPKEYRATIALVNINELSYEQAAEIMGCRIGTVCSRGISGTSDARGSIVGLCPEKGVG